MELDFLLRFPVKVSVHLIFNCWITPTNIVHSQPHVTSPVDFISNYAWGGICSLAAKEEFRNLDRDIENQAKRWKKIIESECPEKEKFPQEWKNKTALQRLCMMRALRPDRMCYALT
jgi:dynein heavy chain, axonemal